MTRPYCVAEVPEYVTLRTHSGGVCDLIYLLAIVLDGGTIERVALIDACLDAANELMEGE